MAGGDSAWRKIIIDQLQSRNKTETNSFQELISLHHRQFEKVNTLRSENLQLTLRNERLRLSGGDGSTFTGGGNGNTNEKIQSLEQRLLATQEELTSLHRKRGESAQEIIRLNSKLHDAEKQLGAKDNSLSESSAINASLRMDIQRYQNNMKELQELNQMLRDEHQALQMAFAALEEKLRKAQDENRQLVDRLVNYKAKDADKMNEENESFLKSSNPTAFLIHTLASFGRKGERMRRELEEAAKEARGGGGGASGGSCAEDRLADGGPFFSSVLPSKMALHFERGVEDLGLGGLARRETEVQPSIGQYTTQDHTWLTLNDAHEGEINAVKWCPTDCIVATGGADRKVKLWDVSKLGECQSRGVLSGSNAGVMSVDFDASGALVLAASNDHASRVWSLADFRLKHTLTGHSGKVLAAKFLGEPSKVVSGSHDRTLKIWDLRSRACIETKFAGSSCNDLVTSDGAGSTIISGHFDKHVRLWDTRADSSPNCIQLQGKVTSLDLSRECNYLLACVRDDTIQLIDLRMSAIVKSFSHDGFKVGCDWARAAFSPGGRRVAAGGADGGVYVWATHSGRLETVLKDHTAGVTAVAWHPHQGWLASVDRGKRAVLWTDA